MEVIIDGIVYVPKENKSKLEMLEEKYKSGNYICIGNRVGSIDKISELDWPKWHADWEYKLIHKKHKSILDAYLTDNSVEIEWFNVDGFYKCKYFIESYNENLEYRLKQQYPIFKRSEDGEVFKITSSGSFGTEYETMLCEDFDGRCILSGKTIPYDKERGLYHLQPVWCWDDGHRSRATMFYDVELKMAIGFSIEKGNEYHWDNMEPITPEQLKTMPFVWEMYQQLLKDKQ